MTSIGFNVEELFLDCNSQEFATTKPAGGV